MTSDDAKRTSASVISSTNLAPIWSGSQTDKKKRLGSSSMIISKHLSSSPEKRIDAHMKYDIRGRQNNRPCKVAENGDSDTDQYDLVPDIPGRQCEHEVGDSN